MKRNLTTFFLLILLVVVYFPGHASGAILFDFAADTTTADTLVLRLNLDSLDQFAEPIFAMEVTFSWDPTRLSFASMSFDNGLVEPWGSMIYSIDPATGLCLMAGAGVSALASSGTVFTARFTYLPGITPAAHSGPWTTCWLLKLNETAIYPPSGVVLDAPEDEGGLPISFRLDQNYPNPFNPTTTIAYALEVVGDVSLSIHNSLGQEVRRTDFGRQSPGEYRWTWDATDNSGRPLAAGVYFYRMTDGLSTRTHKMILLK